MSIIEVFKTWKPYYNDIEQGIKTFDMRQLYHSGQVYNDKAESVKVGDIIRFEEYDRYSKEPTGRYCFKQVNYIVRSDDFWTGSAAYVVFQFEKVNELSNDEMKELSESRANHPRKYDEWHIKQVNHPHYRFELDYMDEVDPQNKALPTYIRVQNVLYDNMGKEECVIYTFVTDIHTEYIAWMNEHPHERNWKSIVNNGVLLI